MSEFVAGFAARHDAAARALVYAFAQPSEGFSPADIRARADTKSSAPRHFKPADASTNPTQGWDPLDPVSEPTGFLDPLAAAHSAGYAEGMAAAAAQASESGDRDRALLAALGEALASGGGLNRENIARALRQTVLALVKRIIGDVGVSPEYLAARIEAATECLADQAESALLRVHPDDVALLEGHLPRTIFAAGDASVARGSFVLESASTIVEDGPELWLEQLARAIDAVAVPPPMLNRFTAEYLETLGAADFVAKPKVSGRLASFDGLLMEAIGLTLPVGTVCQVGGNNDAKVEAEVIGFRNGRTLLMNLGGPAALLPRAPVRPIGPPGEAQVGAALLGRVVDGAGKPIDGLGAIRGAGRWPLAGKLQGPLDRGRVREPLDVGVRAINGLLTIGQGQRVGIMAGSGVGKSVLLGMIVRAAAADVIVIGLIGERSREVADFLETKVAGEARKRAVIVAVPANHSPVLRIRGALRATAIAEGFRAEGKKVLLIMDSLTRVAHAGREIGLALGEPASARGYPPSAIAMLPNLIERAGADVASGGSITAIYTVLADGDDGNDPVVDAARSILDGHIVLSRAMAEHGVYPAIDLGPSVSRVMTDIVAPEHALAARVLRRHLATYEENRDLVLMGAYRGGADPAVDAAIACHPAVMEYIRQDVDAVVTLDAAVEELVGVFGDA